METFGRILSAFNVHLISLSTWLTYAVSRVPSDLTSQQHLHPHLNSLNLSSSSPWYTTLSQSPISTLKIMSSKWKKSNLRSPIHTKVWMIGNHLLHFKDNWLFYRVLIGQAWWLILAVPTLGRLRLGGHKFKNSLGYIMRLSPKKLWLNKVISEGSYYAYILGARWVKIFDIEGKNIATIYLHLRPTWKNVPIKECKLIINLTGYFIKPGIRADKVQETLAR